MAVCGESDIFCQKSIRIYFKMTKIQGSVNLQPPYRKSAAAAVEQQIHKITHHHQSGDSHCVSYDMKPATF